MPRSVKVLIGPSGMRDLIVDDLPDLVEALELQVVHVVVQERQSAARGTRRSAPCP